MTVADSYDAMTSARPYRNALPIEEAARRLRANAGAQFATAAIEAFDAVEEEFQTIRDTTAPHGGCRSNSRVTKASETCMRPSSFECSCEFRTSRLLFVV